MFPLHSSSTRVARACRVLALCLALGALALPLVAAARPPLADPSADDLVCMAHISDIHIAEWSPSEERLREALAFLTRDIEPDLIVCTGDLTAGGGGQSIGAHERNLQTYVDMVEALPIPVVTVPGNHDDAGGLGEFTAVVGPPQGCVDVGRYRLIWFSNLTPADVNVNRLAGDLAGVPDGHAILAAHLPLDWPEGFGNPTLNIDPPTQTKLLRLMRDFDVPLFLSGHLHVAFTRDLLDGEARNVGAGAILDRAFQLLFLDRGNATAVNVQTGTLPLVVVTAPEDGAIVRGPVQIRAVSFGAEGRVLYRIDQGPWNEFDGLGPRTPAAIGAERPATPEDRVTQGQRWAATWDPAGLPPGEHVITAFATGGGKMYRHQVRVVVAER